jgi:hypothetical protein
MANQRVTLPNQQLQPLHNSMNRPIQNFPQDLAAVQAERSKNRCTSTQNDFLVLTLRFKGIHVFRQWMIELGETPPANWSITVARQDFRMAIGCSAI